MPSPNLPTLDAATVYPGQVLIEGTNLSEGRGTTKPFEIFGAPWIDGFLFARELNALDLPGVKFRETWFTPSFSKFQGARCGGCQLHIVNREKFNAVATTLVILAAVKKIYGGKLEFHADYFDKVAGVSAVRAEIENGTSSEKIIGGFKSGLENFCKLREPFLLYR
jgi:uncharacterized protein YbbC (DUF1343 family)